MSNASRPPGRTRRAAAGSTSSDFSTARSVTRSAFSVSVSARAATTFTLPKASARATSFRNVAFFDCASTRVSRIRGAKSLSGIPGKPAPEPTSITSSAESGCSSVRAANSDSPKWRSTISCGSRTAVRLVRSFHFSKISMYFDICSTCPRGSSPAKGRSSSAIFSGEMAAPTTLPLLPCCFSGFRRLRLAYGDGGDLEVSAEDQRTGTEKSARWVFAGGEIGAVHGVEALEQREVRTIDGDVDDVVHRHAGLRDRRLDPVHQQPGLIL